MLPDPVGICNSNEWRNGTASMTSKKESLKNTYMINNEHKIEYFGFPEGITQIQYNATALAESSSSDNFEKNTEFSYHKFNVRFGD